MFIHSRNYLAMYALRCFVVVRYLICSWERISFCDIVHNMLLLICFLFTLLFSKTNNSTQPYSITSLHKLFAFCSYFFYLNITSCNQTNCSVWFTIDFYYMMKNVHLRLHEILYGLFFIFFQYLNSYKQQTSNYAFVILSNTFDTLVGLK